MKLPKEPTASDRVVAELRGLHSLVKIAVFEGWAHDAEPTADGVMRRLGREIANLKGRLMTIINQVEAENSKLRARVDQIREHEDDRVERWYRKTEQEAAWAHEHPGGRATELPVSGFFVYILWGRDGDPLYVGSTGSLMQRMASHLGGRGPVQPHLIHRITITEHPTRERMIQAEWRLIGRYQPPGNTIGVNRTDSHWFPNEAVEALL